METVRYFFQTNLDMVFFVYGLAFLLMGAAILLQPKKLSELGLARNAWVLGMFGLLHGANELLDMWVVIRGRSEAFDFVRLAALVSSYVFLFEFGRRLFEADFKNRPFRKLSVYAAPLTGASILAIDLLYPGFWASGGNLARYLLGFTGSILTGFGLIRYKAREKAISPDHPSAVYFYWVGGTFLCYAFLGGVMASPGGYFPADRLNTQTFLHLTGLPIQVLRALCAVIAAYGIVRILSIFNWEVEEKLHKTLESENAARRDFHDIVSRNTDGILVMDAAGTVKFANPAAARLTGQAHDRLLTSKPGRELRDGASFEIEIPPANGRAGYGEVTASATQWGGRPAWLVTVRDITERKQKQKELAEKEQQLFQSQKMDSIGRMAAGIAHDFNNIITTISGFVDILLEEAGAGPVRTYAEKIRDSAANAIGITRQLLAFSRKQEIKPEITSFNDAVKYMENLLKPLLGGGIRLKTTLAPDLLKIKADPMQLNQVVMNIAVNARDAMQPGGTLSIETLNGPEGAERQAILRISDTGSGISRETLPHIFEPFFTTKQPGKGTGLGLSIVYGIVKQNGGSIAVESEPDKGTAFIISFPAAEKSPAKTADGIL